MSDKKKILIDSSYQKEFDENCENIINNASELTELYLADINLSDDNVSYVCELINNIHINYIDLTNNNLTNKSIEFLLELLEKNKKIEKINIDYNDNISEDMKIILKNKLIENLSYRLLNNDYDLSWLYLSYMHLTDDNISYLCNLLLNNNPVKYIDLYNNNNLTNKSVEYLLELLEKNKKIEKINLNNNDNISEDMKTKLNNKIIENVN